jgi:MoaA/NifB/PqqE/SkfB family radical SAM enzyme
MATIESVPHTEYGLRPGAEEFPLMVVIAAVYPCNLGCPFCPYTDGNSEIRKYYHDRGGDLMPVGLWNKMAEECGEYGAWMRITGGGEPMLHKNMTEMIEHAKVKGARVWLNTNGSMFGPMEKHRDRLRRIIFAGVDLIEFSMDAADAATYALLRPPHGGPPRHPEKWWNHHLDNIKAALEIRKELATPTRIVVSMIRQEAMDEKLEEGVRFWLRDIGVDDVITRKYLTWDDNTTLPLGQALDRHLYAELPEEKAEPCVWPFERLNVDTLGRIALCGQDISFRTSDLFPNANDAPLKEIWQGEMFNWYRRMHLEGRGAECFPCRGCSAWLAGVRDWKYGWLRVLNTSGEHVKEVMRRDLGVEVDVYQPEAAAELEHDLSN